MRYVFILSPKEMIGIIKNNLKKVRAKIQIWWLKKRLPKLMRKANDAVAKEAKAERKLTRLYTDLGRAERQNGFMS